MCELEWKRILLNIVETRQFKPNGVKEATFFSDNFQIYIFFGGGHGGMI